MKINFSENSDLESFASRKRSSLHVADSFYRLSFDSRAEKVENCGTWLSFTHDSDGSGNFDSHGRLTYANFCKDRLCPMCNWRRSLKIFHEVSCCMDSLKDGYKFYFLTLTVPNVDGADLGAKIRDMQQSWQRFLKKKWPKKLIKGYVKTVEINYNDRPSDPAYDTYHPHFHVCIALPKSYGSKIYFKKDDWLTWWKESSRDPSIKFVNIKQIYYETDSGLKVLQKDFKSSIEFKAAVAELTKYALKPSNYIFPDPKKTDHVIYPLATQLNGFRMVSFGGVFADARVGIDDFEEGNLINVDPADLLIPPSIWSIVNHYGWRVGVYVLVGSEEFKDKKYNSAALNLGYYHPKR